MPHTPKVILPKDKQEPSHKRLGMRLEKRVFYLIFGIFDGTGKFALATELYEFFYRDSVLFPALPGTVRQDGVRPGQVCGETASSPPFFGHSINF